VTRIAMACAALAVVGVGLAGCGGDDEGGDEPEIIAEDDLKTCLEEAGAKLRDIEVSFADPPPDFSAEFGEEQATVWVEDSPEGVSDVAASQEELSQLGDGEPEDRGPPIEVANVYAAPFLGPLSEENRASIEGCIE
jgi:hypothetical protein